MRSPGGHRIAVAIACATLLVGGCFLGSFGDLEGGEGSDAATDTSSSDAAIDSGGDAASGDAFVDDVFVPFDATPGVRFCDTQIDASFCDDFDQPDATPLAKWQPPNVGTGASLGATNTGLSAPNAVLAEVRANVTPSLDIAASISHVLPGTTNAVRYTYDLLVDTYDLSGSTAYVGAMDQRVGLTDVELRLNLEPTGVEIEGVTSEGDGGVIYQPFGSKLAPIVGTWHHVEIDVDYTQMPATVTFYFDGALIIDDVHLNAATFGPGQVTIEAAFLYALTPTSGWKLRVDNVAVFTK